MFLLRMLASTTSALSPDEPAGPVPHLMSFGADQAVVLASPMSGKWRMRQAMPQTMTAHNSCTRRKYAIAHGFFLPD